MLQLRYRNLLFPAGVTAVTTRKEMLLDAAGEPYAEQVTFDVEGEWLTDIGTADLVNQCTIMERSLRIPGGDLVLLRDDGGVAMALTNATSYTGVRVLNGPDYFKAEGAELVNYRSFRFSASADYALPVGNVIISYMEVLELWGGGEEFAMLEPITGRAIKQRLKESSAYRGTQSGQAVGLLGYPAVPDAIFPAAVLKKPRVRRGNATRVGRGYKDFPIAWEYEFGSGYPLDGEPTAWR